MKGLRSDIDMEMQIVDTLRLLAISLTYIHVKGHQDNDPQASSNQTGPTKPLSRQAVLNIECDRMATAALLNAPTAPAVTFFPASKVTLSVDGITVTRKLPRMIRKIVGRASQLASFTRRYGWTAMQFEQIDWAMYRTPAYTFSLPKRLFSIKWLNDLPPFQARMHKYGQSSMAGCPHECECTSEDHNHLLHCPSPQCQELSASMKEDLNALCLTHKIDPDLRRVMLTLVDPLLGLFPDYDLPPEYDALITFQVELHPDSV
jgi:hypothetical protein